MYVYACAIRVFSGTHGGLQNNDFLLNSTEFILENILLKGKVFSVANHLLLVLIPHSTSLHSTSIYQVPTTCQAVLGLGTRWGPDSLRGSCLT